MAAHYAPTREDVKEKNGFVLKVEQTEGAGPAFRPAFQQSQGVGKLSVHAFGEAGRGCSSITALLLMQVLFLGGRKDGSGCPPASSPREGSRDS